MKRPKFSEQPDYFGDDEAKKAKPEPKLPGNEVGLPNPLNHLLSVEDGLDVYEDERNLPRQG